MPPIPSRLPALIAACLVVALIAMGAVSKAFAHDFKLGDLTIDHPWARASAGPARSGAAFLTIHNSGGADRLLAISGDVAARVELHTHLMDGDVMRMRQVAAVEVPANGTAALLPGGHHVMLIGLTAPLIEGDSFPLTLTFETAGDITIEVKVEAVGSRGPASGAEDGMNHGSMNHESMGHGSKPKSN